MNSKRFGFTFAQIRGKHVVNGIRLICVIAFIFSLYQITQYQLESARSQANFQEIREISRETATTSSSMNAVVKKRAILPFFASLHEMNNETVGWLQIADTRIDYPIVQANDNEFYLDHDFKKNQSRSGTIFMDYRNEVDPLDFNTVIYGHHMKNGTMFKDLVKFQNKAFLQEHPIIHMKTKYEETSWRIFAVYVTDTAFDYIRPEYIYDEDFKLFIDTVKSKAKLSKEWTIDKEARILTLSTCSYAFDNARLVVQAELIE
jgi:sortase B